MEQVVDLQFSGDLIAAERFEPVRKLPKVMHNVRNRNSVGFVKVIAGWPRGCTVRRL
jgi:hypothetical protein